jgi:uncharacterized protein DUF2637
VTGDRMIRIATAATVVCIGAVAAYVSYRHAYEVVSDHGETGAPAVLTPLTVDGLMFVASMVMLDSARRGQSAPGLAKVALGLGIGATVAANVLHGVAHGPVGSLVAAWPAVCLVLVVELLMTMIRRGRVAEVTTDPVIATARDRFAEVLAAGHVPSIRAIRKELRVGHPRAIRVRAALAE